MIIVTGFHGSGTSSITKSLHKLGVVFKGPLTTGPNHEHRGARDVNERVLLTLTGHDWKRIPDYDRVVNFDRTGANQFPNINWKDPRACITMPVWRDKVDKVVWVHRNVQNVIKTYQRRHRKTNSQQFIIDMVAGYEERLQRALEDFQISYVRTDYETWYKWRNSHEVARVLAFCLDMPDHIVIDKRLSEISGVVRGLRMPANQ